MKKKLLVLGFVATAMGIYTLLTGTGCMEPSKGKGSTSINNNYANPPFDMGLTQQSADTFSWRTFIAMCWPADNSTCGPDTTNGSSILNGKGQVVWGTYLNSEQVFVQPPARPDRWCANGMQSTMYTRLPKNVQELAQKTGVYRFIERLSKSSHSINGIAEVGGSLVDQNGRFVRYEVRMNETEYGYIIKYDLWDSVGQSKFKGAADFPGGKAPRIGCMELKAAWKVMGAGDDTTKFYKIRAIVFNDRDGNDPSVVTLGLVGLHIARRTPTQSDWVWSTFEQNDNLTKSFYNPASKDSVNTPPKDREYVELDTVTKKPLHKPTQVVRVNAVDDKFVDSINIYYQNMLKGSVWENYHLVSTEWLQFEYVAPNFLANSVLETYMQGPHPASHGNTHVQQGQNYFVDSTYSPFSNSVSASCMGCHYQATVGNSPHPSGNFSFMLGDAKGVKK